MMFMRLLRRQRPLTALKGLSNETTRDTHTGAVRSVQAAELALSPQGLRELWTPANLERLARTYWRFLARVTLGLVHVRYGERARSVVLLVPALKLITFAEPEYEMDAERGVVRWRILRGLLVAREHRITTDSDGAGVTGHLQIEIRRLQERTTDPTAQGREHARARLQIEIEVENFYPAIAFALSRRLYDITQSRIHVLVTRAFLRSLARGTAERGIPKLAVSKVGRLSRPSGPAIRRGAL
jgi:hypothetical protein